MNQIVLQDSGGQSWSITVDDTGVLYSKTITGGTVNTVVLNDPTNAASWKLGVSTAGLLTTTSVTLGSYSTVLALTSSTLLSIWDLGVTLGGLITTSVPPVSVLSQQSQTFPMVMLFDITSVEDGTVLRVSQVGLTYGGNTYTAAVKSVGGFETYLESSPLGIMAIRDISITLGDADGSLTAWDNAHYFKGAKITATLIFWNPTTKAAASSDSRIVFKGICNAPRESSPTTLGISAYSRFNAEFCLLPADRISTFSQTTFPGEGLQDCSDANSSSPANANSVGYAWFHGETSGGIPAHGANDLYLRYLSCGYGPLRGTTGWAGGNPLGNFLVASATATAGLSSLTTIGNSGASYPSSNGLANHVVVIISGTGAGQAKRIASNTATQITVANAFTTIPDGTSVFCVLYGFCGRDAASCQARGMYSTDSSARNTYRNRAITYVPTNYRWHSHPLTTNPNQAKYNGVIPLVYGTAMVRCQILFMQSSSAVAYGELLVCQGPITSMAQLITGNTIVPYFGSSYAFVNKATGQWNYRNGVIGNYFADPYFTTSHVSGGVGDSDILNQMAMIMLQVPVEFVGNASDFQASVLVNGLQVQQYDQNGVATGSPVTTSNPAWIILDLLRRSGWQPSEINFASFYAFSVYANQLINIQVTSTTTTPSARFAINPTILQQAPVPEVFRSVMLACRALLTYDSNGLLRIDCEDRITNTTLTGSTLAGTQWAQVVDGAGITIGSQLSVGTGGAIETVTVTNVQLSGGLYFQFQATFANAHLNGDPVQAAYAYSFDPSSVALDSQNNQDIKRTSLPTSQTPNQFVVAFQDSLRGYASDSVTLSSTWEANQFGALVVGSIGANGVSTVDAAIRLAQLALFKAHGRRNRASQILSRGNLFVTLTTTVKAIDVRIGSFVKLTYAKESWTAKPFRVVQISPTPDAEFPFWKIKLTLREHDDGWYDTINGEVNPSESIQPAPKPPIIVPPVIVKLHPFRPIFN